MRWNAALLCHVENQRRDDMRNANRLRMEHSDTGHSWEYSYDLSSTALITGTGFEAEWMWAW